VTTARHARNDTMPPSAQSEALRCVEEASDPALIADLVTGALSSGVQFAEPQVEPTRTSELVRGSSWLIVSIVASAGTGALFWLWASHLTATASVGSAAALFSSVMFITYATSMGLPVAAARYGADSSESATVLYSWALLYTSATAVAGTALFFAIVRPNAEDVLRAHGFVAGVALVAVIVIGTSISVMNDVRLIAAHRWNMIVLRVTLVGVARLLLVPVHAGQNEALWLFFLGAGIPALSGYLGLFVMGPLTGFTFRLRPHPPHASEAFRHACVNYIGMLAAQAPTFVLPVLVLSAVGAADNARFFIGWSIAGVAFVIPHTIGHALLVEGAKGDSDLRREVRTTLLFTVAFMAIALAVVVVAGGGIALVYGKDYSAAAPVLQRLMLAGIPWALTSIWLNEARIHQDDAAVLVITGVLAAAILLPAMVLVPSHGIGAATGAWLAGHFVAAGVAASVVRARRPMWEASVESSAAA
jgi:O-antigen/teichoic acid export membrane protein